jgi:hypothetical protein
MGYCTVSDVGMRLGLNAAQRQNANSRLEAQIRRAAIEIDQEFRYYGRETPADAAVTGQLDGAHLAGATSIDLVDASSFSTSGKGDIDGDSFAWTGKSGNTLTGVTNVSDGHHNHAVVSEGEMVHVLREINADLAAALYLEDESTFQRTDGEGMRANAMRERAIEQMRRLAHLGRVI